MINVATANLPARFGQWSEFWEADSKGVAERVGFESS